MGDYPREVRLKDGSAVVLRPVEAGDLDALHRFFCELPTEDRLYLKNDVTDRAVVGCWVNGLVPERKLTLVAVADGELVGDASLLVESHGWSRHVGELRCVVARSWQNRGLGTCMAHALVENAVRREVEKLVVQVMDTQAAAVRVFERVGFRREATLPNHVRDLGGELHDLWLLTNTTAIAFRELEDQMVEMDVVFRG